MLGFVTRSQAPSAVVWPGLALSEKITRTSGTAASHVSSAAHSTSVVLKLTISAPWGQLASLPVERIPASPCEHLCTVSGGANRQRHQ